LPLLYSLISNAQQYMSGILLDECFIIFETLWTKMMLQCNLKSDIPLLHLKIMKKNCIYCKSKVTKKSCQINGSKSKK
jgi:hypothetical protein